MANPHFKHLKRVQLALEKSHNYQTVRFQFSVSALSDTLTRAGAGLRATFTAIGDLPHPTLPTITATSGSETALDSPFRSL